MPGTWFPGQVAVGGKVFNNNVIVNGQAILQRGLTSYPPVVTAPSTVATGGTVYNTTGVGCMVYLAASTTTGTVSIIQNGVVIPLTASGTAGANVARGPFYVAANAGIIVPYTGTLTWEWTGV